VNEKTIGKPKATGSTMRGFASWASKNEHFVLVVILVALIVAFAVMTNGKSVTTANASNILLQSATRGIASIGQAFVILTAGIDLSVGGMATLAGMVAASMMTGGSGFPAGAIALMILVGIAVGAGNGALVSRVRMPALIVTLASWQMLDGIAYLHCGGYPIGNLPDAIAFTGQGKVGQLPVPAIIFIAVAAVAYLVLNHTAFGRSIYAVGGNPVSAWLSGVKTPNITFMVYLISGLCSALAGLIITSRLMSGSLLGATGLELDSIAAVVIGGVSLAGGRGTLIGVVLGVFIMGVINNGMNLMVVPAAYQKIVKGIIIVVAVAVDSMRRRTD